MTYSNGANQGGLTWKVLADAYPVVNSDRRKIADLLGTNECSGDLKSDDVFYSWLLSRIRGDTDILKQLDVRLSKDSGFRQGRRSFFFRVSSWLARRAEGTEKPTEIASCHDDFFPSGSAERELHRMVKSVASGAKMFEELGRPDGETQEIAPDWQAELRRVRALVNEMEAPSVESAERIWEAARALVEICADHDQWQRQERLSIDRQALVAALDAARQIEPAAVPAVDVSTIGAETLGLLKRLTDELVAAVSRRREIRGRIATAEAESERLLADKAWVDLASRAILLNDLQRADSEQGDEIAGIGERVRIVVAESDTPDGEASRPQISAAAAAQGSVQLVGREPKTAAVGSNSSVPAMHPEVPIQADDLADDPTERGELPPAVANESIELLEMPLADPEPDTYVDDHTPTSADDELIETSLSSAITEAEGAPASAHLKALVADYLDRGESALAWYLALLAEEQGQSAGVPAASLQAIAAGPCVAGPDDVASLPLGEVLAAAMAALERCESRGEESVTERAQCLTFAALLRPAVLAPTTSAREHLANIPMSGVLAAFAPLRKVLSELGRDFQPRREDLKELGGAERLLRTPLALERVSDWVTQARNSHHTHQPSTRILHELSGTHGAFGRVIEAAQTDRPGAERDARRLIALYPDRVSFERLITECERESGRPKRDRIRGMALEWICRKLEDGRDRLEEWTGARAADHGLLDDRHKQTLQRQVGALRKVIDGLPEPTDGIYEDPLDLAVQRWLVRAIGALRSLLEGTDSGIAPQRLSEALRRPLLRLPGYCQPRAPERDEFAAERAVQRSRLFDALRDPRMCLAADERTALDARLSEGALLPAMDLLERLRRDQTLTSQEVLEKRQELEEVRDREQRNATDKIEALRLELATLYNLDLRTGEQLRKELEQLDTIAEAVPFLPISLAERKPEIPPDFPQLREIMIRVDALRDQVKDEISQGQRERLKRIAVEQPSMAMHVNDIVATLDERDPTTVEDIIASLQAGQPVVELEQEGRDGFSQFFPDFVEQISSSEEVNRGRVMSALASGGSIGVMNFARLDEDGRRGAKQLLESWWQVENALPQIRDPRDPARRVLEALGFTGIDLYGDITPIAGKLRVMTLRCTPPEADTWFLPPDFGSSAKGSYRLFLCRPEVPADQIGSELAKAGVDTPSLLFMFGRLSRQRRLEFAQRMRSSRQRVLLIDEVQIFFLMTLEVNRLRTLFACATPFGYHQPYTTDPGSIPREMFFGRKDEIRRIQSRSADGCLVYGGRQLGKSALLNQVRKIYHRSDDGWLVCYRSCDVLGGPTDPASSVWRVISAELTTLGILDGPTADAEKVVTAIAKWLDVDPTRRILMLLDETDQFMSAEARSGFPHLTRLKEAMIGNDWRFKVVFAGLHNVRRASKAPNTPLAHLGEPICVGPLNTTPENRAEARRLVVEPMRAAGFEYAHPGLGWDILARVNHYPSLVQVFCKELLTDLYRRPQSAASGPRWRIERAQIFEGVSYRQIAAAIRGKFRLTLDLDPRYDLIAHVLAHHRFYNGDEAVLRNGLSVAELGREVGEYWPPSLQRLEGDAFAAFLDEMVDLGVLSRLGSQQDRYGLRTALVAQMLGGLEDVEKQLQDIMSLEPRIDYDAMFFFRRLVSDNAFTRAPLTDWQLEQLFNRHERRVAVVVTDPGLSGGDMANALRSIGGEWEFARGPHEIVVVMGGVAEFRRAMTNPPRPGLRRIVIVVSEPSFLQEWIDWAGAQPEVKAGRLRPIFVAPWSWLWEFRRSTSIATPVSVFVKGTWGNQMLRSFLAETDNTTFDHVERRRRLIDGSGGVPALLTAACAKLSDDCRAGNADVDHVLETWLGGSRLRPVDAGLPDDLVSVLPMIDDVESEDVSSLLELIREGWSSESPAPDMTTVLRFFADVGLIVAGDPMREGVRLTPFGRLLQRSAET